MSENDIQDDVVEQEQPTSEETKFFGIKTQIMPRAGDDVPGEEEYKIEVVDPRKKEDRKPKKAEAAKDSDDDESEVENYSARVRKRIDKLKYEFHEERRQREEAARLRDEAITYAQRIQEENKRLTSLVGETQKAIQQQIVEKAKAAYSLAENELKRAHEAGDADAIVKAQQKLTQAQLTEAAAPAYARKLTEAKLAAPVQAEAAPAPKVDPLQQVARSVPKPDPKASAWQSRNEWFGSDPEMTNFAYGVHQKLLSEYGEDFASTDRYYEAIDNRMRQVFPDRFSEEDDGYDSYEESKPVRTATPRRVPVVAPAKRSSGSAPRKVQLTATQVALAKRLGLTPQQYASQVMKEMGNG
jgi:hypothetical protein